MNQQAGKYGHSEDVVYTEIKLCFAHGALIQLPGVLQVSTTPLEETLPNECLAEEQLNILLGPLLCGERLQEHHDFLEVHLP